MADSSSNDSNSRAVSQQQLGTSAKKGEEISLPEPELRKTASATTKAENDFDEKSYQTP